MNNYNLLNKDISYYDINGNKQKIGTINHITADHIKIKFTQEGISAFRALADKESLDINDLLVLLKTNHKEINHYYGREDNTIEGVLHYIMTNAKKGLTELFIGDIDNDKIYLKSGQFITSPESIEKTFNNSLKNETGETKESIIIKSIKIKKEGAQYIGNHIIIKAAADSQNDYKTYMEFAALETLKESGLKVPEYSLEIINKKPYLVMENFSKNKPFNLDIKRTDKGTIIEVANRFSFYKTKLSYDMTDMAKCFSKNNHKLNEEMYEHSYLVAIKLANSIYSSSALKGDFKEFMDARKQKVQSSLMKTLSFNLLIGNTDMHGGNVKVLLNGHSNALTNKVDFEFAPFFDITPHSINQMGNNELLKHGKNLNTLDVDDLTYTRYRGIARNEGFKKEFNAAKKMVEIYKEKVRKIFEDSPEVLNKFNHHFSKINEFMRIEKFEDIDYDLRTLEKGLMKSPEKVKPLRNNYKLGS